MALSTQFQFNLAPLSTNQVAMSKTVIITATVAANTAGIVMSVKIAFIDVVVKVIVLARWRTGVINSGFIS